MYIRCLAQLVACLLLQCCGPQVIDFNFEGGIVDLTVGEAAVGSIDLAFLDPKTNRCGENSSWVLPACTYVLVPCPCSSGFVNQPSYVSTKALQGCSVYLCQSTPRHSFDQLLIAHIPALPGPFSQNLAIPAFMLFPAPAPRRMGPPSYVSSGPTSPRSLAMPQALRSQSFVILLVRR
jgi:hypothetical protein